MRVLVADDEHDMARALEAMLKREGYEVDIVYDGQEALNYGETGTYDCIVLDIMMPVMDGLSVVRALRARDVDAPSQQGIPDARAAHAACGQLCSRRAPARARMGLRWVH